MKKTAILTIVTTVACVGALLAQHDAGGDKKKPLSPPATATATVSGSDITVSYSAPSVRGRKIMGELVPYGKVWRTGANAATTLKTDANLRIGDLSVPKGTYTLYSIPEADGWTLIVNKQTGQWGTNYDAAQDLGRVKMNVSKAASPVETFVIDFHDVGTDKGKMRIAWENAEATVPVSVVN